VMKPDGQLEGESSRIKCKSDFEYAGSIWSRRGIVSLETLGTLRREFEFDKKKREA